MRTHVRTTTIFVFVTYSYLGCSQFGHSASLLRLQAMPLHNCLSWFRDHVLPMFRLCRTGAILTWKVNESFTAQPDTLKIHLSCSAE